MRKQLKIACIALLFGSSVGFAAASCEGFQIKIKNNLADDLLITSIKFNGGKIQPGSFEKLNSKTEQAFTVNSSAKNTPMSGIFTLRSLSLPSKTVKISYNLENAAAACIHEDKSAKTDYSLDKTRKLGEVLYTISNS